MRRTFLAYVPTWQDQKVRCFVIMMAGGGHWEVNLCSRQGPCVGHLAAFAGAGWEDQGVCEEFMAVLLVQILCILTVTEGCR